MTIRGNRRSGSINCVAAPDGAEAAMLKFIGNRIRESRIKLGYSAHDLAKMAGIQPIELGVVEAGLGRVPALRLIGIATALNLPLGALFGARLPNSEAAAAGASDPGAQPSAEVARLAQAYERIRDPSKRNMLLTLSELFADGSGRSQMDVTH